MNKQIHFIQSCFSQLSNPLKLEIYLKIMKEGCNCDLENQDGFQGNCVTSVMEDLDLPQSTASTYIAALRDHDLIECQKNGKFLYCKPRKETLVKIKSFIDGMLLQMEE